VPLYAWLVIPPSLIGFAVVIAVIRADRRDLPSIVRSLTRTDWENKQEPYNETHNLPGHQSANPPAKTGPEQVAQDGGSIPAKRKSRPSRHS
jgi:hypothetical protein